MRTGVRQSAFSLVEMVVVLATILILAGALLGVGRYLTVRANIDLTNSELEVIATALQQYYDDFEMFPVTVKDYNSDGTPDPYDEKHLEYDLNGTVQPDNAIDELIAKVSSDIPADSYAPASSSALFYFLDKNPNSRKIVEALTDSLISSKDVAGQSIQITLTATGQTIDLPRFIDAWGTSILYVYTDDTAFPILTSAGPDMTFGTPDDLTNP